MKITAKEGRYNKVHIHIDDEYLLTVDAAYWLSCGYVSGDELNERELAAFKDAAGSRRAFNAGAQLLSRREHSSKELYNKLLKNYEPEFAAEAVARLVEIGMLNDERFANMYASELYEKKGYGKKRILYELNQKGVDRTLAEEAVEELFQDEDNIERIVDIIRKKYYNVQCDEKQRRRATAYLMRAGYSPSEIRRAMECFSVDTYDEEGWY
ncbi:MAG: recombination regulator RecX [Clostridia bacterium]|nr:recombination regulator RecX [Clostridia bacterium]